MFFKNSKKIVYYSVKLVFLRKLIKLDILVEKEERGGGGAALSALGYLRLACHHSGEASRNTQYEI